MRLFGGCVKQSPRWTRRTEALRKFDTGATRNKDDAKPDELELAWAGGLFEGEGSITYSQSGRPYKSTGKPARTLRLTIGMTDLDVLQRFHAAVGMRGSLNGPYDRGENKPIYHWTAQWRMGREVAQLLRPYLGERRTKRLDEILALGVPATYSAYAEREKAFAAI